MQSLQGGLGSAIAALGVIVLIWSVVQIAMGFIEAHNEYKIKGALMLAAGAMLVSLPTVITSIF